MRAAAASWSWPGNPDALTVQTKYIFVTGGVSSSLGKGIFCASLGRLLKAHGLRVTIQKLDPYINVDPGTMNPYEHGEVYVTDDGAETDLDLGHYERFLDETTTQANNVTTGRVYREVINKERAGDYLGKTVQVVPHIIDEIKRWILRLAEAAEYDVVLCEIGGTVGDIESQPYLEAIRQLRYELGATNTLSAHLTLVPYLAAAGELKTKPTQHSVKILLSYGLQPDILVCRSDRPLDEDLRRKIALFCNVAPQAVIEAVDARTIYEVPLKLAEQGVEKLALQKLDRWHGIATREPDLSGWMRFLRRLNSPRDTVTLALVGKYVAHQDAYKSISESFILAGAELGVKVAVRYILSDTILEVGVAEALREVGGIVVAPGFGRRGIDGKIAVARHARECDIPYFGICLGLQCAIIEFARNVCGWEDAHSTEFMPETPHPVIDFMEEQRHQVAKGGTMRLGGYACHLVEGSLAHRIYGKVNVRERHRHRYEVSNVHRSALAAHGLRFSGLNLARDLVEIAELPDKRWFLGTQFHPEYRSRVGAPHPLFTSFVQAALAYSTGT